MLPITRYKAKSPNEECYADHYNSTKHIVQSAMLSQCDRKLIFTINWFHMLSAKYSFMRASIFNIKSFDSRLLSPLVYWRCLPADNKIWWLKTGADTLKPSIGWKYWPTFFTSRACFKYSFHMYIFKSKNSQNTCFLTTSTYIQQNGIADPRADWAMISNRPGNDIKRESIHHAFSWTSVFFSQVNLILLWIAIFFYFHQVLLGVMWLLTLNIWGVFLSIREGSHWLISPFWLFRGLSSALTEDTCQKPKWCMLAHSRLCNNHGIWPLLWIIAISWLYFNV